jgi:2-polyprenyl-3-methyl-5-hydroxy-6-metoxy-1,4-benzoquinol methylase
MDKKGYFIGNIKDIEMKPNWIRHVDTKFNILHVLRTKKDLYKLLDNIEQYHRDVLITVPDAIDGNQSDNGREFDKNHYDRYSREFTDWHTRHANGIMNRTNCLSALDVGCGLGSMVKGFLKNKIDIYGIDISKYAIENCNKEITKRVSIGDIRKIDTLPKKKFDLVTCYNVLEYVSDPDIAIYNMSNLSDKWMHITVRDIRCVYPEDVKMFDPTLITGRSIKWWIDEFEKEGFDIIFDLDYTWLMFESRYALMPTGCPVLQALFRKKEYVS